MVRCEVVYYRNYSVYNFLECRSVQLFNARVNALITRQ